MNIGKRIKQLRGDRSVQECAEAIGVTRSAWYQWEEKEDDQSLKHENLVNLAAFFGLSVEEFLNTENPARERHSVKEKPVEYIVTDPGMYNVRLYEHAQVSAGNGIINSDLEPPRIVQVPQWMVPDAYDVSQVILAPIDGDSMFPTLKHGELGLFYLLERIPREGLIYMFTSQEHTMVKRAFKRPGGGWIMKPDNTAGFDPVVIPPHEKDKHPIIGRLFKNIGNL